MRGFESSVFCQTAEAYGPTYVYTLILYMEHQVPPLEDWKSLKRPWPYGGFESLSYC